MLRPVLFAAAVVALIAPAPAAAPDLTGNWMLSTVTPAGESVICILKVEKKDGKPAASVVFSPENIDTTVSEFKSTDAGLAVTVKQVRNLQGRPLTNEYAFVGVHGKDPKQILGSTGDNRFRTRARLTATDKTTLEKGEMVVRTPLPEPMQKIQQLNVKASQTQSKMLTEKDTDKKKDLQKEFSEAVRELNERSPELYRETVEKHADSPAAFDAAMNVLRSSARTKLTPEVAAKMLKVIQDQGTPYGPLYMGVSLAPVVDTLASQKGLEALAVAAIEPAAKGLSEDAPAAIQSAVLASYQNALTKAGKEAEAKPIAARLEKLEAKIDAEYLKTVPPFKPTTFVGRKDKSANQVVMMELFTGAQCPPCVAADAAFDALVKAYKPTDLVLVQYHMHIPGSDPMTNTDTIARWDYYRKLFAEEVRGVPSSLFNGKVQGGGGGGMAASENKFNQYSGFINPLLEKSTDLKIAGKARRTGDKLDIDVEVANAAGDDLKLRLLVVEDTVKYAGSNGIRFHHHVVRAMPGGAEGIAVKDKSLKHTASVDLAEVRKNLAKYLDDYTAKNPNRPFARPDRPLDMKNVQVIAMVQNDKTGEILQAAQFEIEGKGTSATSSD